jgi:hypothetical protein
MEHTLEIGTVLTPLEGPPHRLYLDLSDFRFQVDSGQGKQPLEQYLARFPERRAEVCVLIASKLAA